MKDNIKLPVQLTKSALNKIKFFINSSSTQHSQLKLRIYIYGGGCGGFQYGFVLDDQVSKNDILIENNGAVLVIDPMSLQYLFGGIVDYYEGLEGSKFIIINPNAKTTCSCGSSFSI